MILSLRVNLESKQRYSNKPNTQRRHDVNSFIKYTVVKARTVKFDQYRVIVREHVRQFVRSIPRVNHTHVVIECLLIIDNPRRLVNQISVLIIDIKSHRRVKHVSCMQVSNVISKSYIQQSDSPPFYSVHICQVTCVDLIKEATIVW